MNTTKSKEQITDTILREANIFLQRERITFKNGVTKWKILLKKRTAGYVIPFVFDWETKGDMYPSTEELMQYVTKYDPGTFYEFCDLQGYNTDSRADKRNYDEHTRQYRNVVKYFTPEQIKELRELDEDQANNLTA